MSRKAAIGIAAAVLGVVGPALANAARHSASIAPAAAAGSGSAINAPELRTASTHPTAPLTFIILVLGSAAAVTLILGAVGLYGVLAYVVTLRTRELAIRIALGASPRAVAGAMTRYGVGLTGVGVVVGLGIFALVARFLRALLFGVAASDPVTLVGSALVLFAIAMVASWVPARRAGRVDPAEALRAE